MDKDKDKDKDKDDRNAGGDGSAPGQDAGTRESDDGRPASDDVTGGPVDDRETTVNPVPTDDETAGDGTVDEAPAVGEDTTESGGATIIDFETFRRRIEEQAAPLGLNLSLGKHVKDGIRQYLIEHVIPKGKSSGDVDLTFDAEFLKKHGPGILGTVMLSFANSLAPSSVDFTLGGTEKAEPRPEQSPAPVPDAGAEAKPEPGSDIVTEAEGSPGDGRTEPKERDVKLKIDVDLIKLLKDFLKPKKT